MDMCGHILKYIHISGTDVLKKKIIYVNQPITPVSSNLTSGPMIGYTHDMGSHDRVDEHRWVSCEIICTTAASRLS